ncbi:MAG: UbiD family decarboxylase [Desulfobacterales bacterium]|nr:UbiD family decarboxylase [Desulfobacterales bacterium]
MAEISYNDLREYIEQIEKIDRCQVIEGADWDLEIGVLLEAKAAIQDSPLLIFDKIKGYKQGYRIASNVIHTPRRFAFMTGLPLEAKGVELVQAWRERVKAGIKPVAPVEVESGPLLENIDQGDDVDLFKFPSPRWHEHDGGRYIGTGVMVINKDPDTGWVNLGTYRVQIHGKNRATIYMSPGRHGNIIRKKYWEKGLSCPVAVVCGSDPLLWTASSNPIPAGMSEYEYAGWLRGRPVEVVKGPVTGLPLPARAEIVLEGELLPPGVEDLQEGPFGEWTGYYASGVKPEPAFRVKAVLHRNDPIILGEPPLLPTIDHFSFGKHIMRAAVIWDELDKQVPEVKGVWTMEGVGPMHMHVVSIKQRYGGHAKQAAMAVGGFYVSSYMNKICIIVDDDIDPANIHEVLWAIVTRCDPADSVEIIKHCWGSMLNASLSPEKLAKGDLEHSRIVITACKPYEWINKFPKTIGIRPELVREVKAKWKHLFQE